MKSAKNLTTNNNKNNGSKTNYSEINSSKEDGPKNNGSNNDKSIDDISDGDKAEVLLMRNTILLKVMVLGMMNWRIKFLKKMIMKVEVHFILAILYVSHVIGNILKLDK